MIKETEKKTIYIRLIEGTESFVPVPAIYLKERVFEIEENAYLQLEDDVSSIWEFFPGDTVRCTNKDGDLVAIELLQSNFPNRKVYQLIFKIVKSLGKITIDQLQEFESEIKFLCSDNNIIQKEHPIVKLWIDDNCRQI